MRSNKEKLSETGLLLKSDVHQRRYFSQILVHVCTLTEAAKHQSAKNFFFCTFHNLL